MALNLDDALAQCPLVAILRGVAPAEAIGIGGALIEAGLRIVEVPLNSPQPLESIRLLERAFGDKALIGAGTVMTPADVEGVARAGGRLAVSPHCDAEVIRAALARGMAAMPGAMTPTEIFAARAAGATTVKLFPAELIPPQAVRALRAVTPRELKLLPVGGVTPENIALYLAAGADGFGMGSSLYQPGRDAGEVGRRARAFVEALAAARKASG